MKEIIASYHPVVAVSYYLLRRIIGFPIRLVFLRKVTGIRNIPIKGCAIVAFNHQSFFDFLCFTAVSPRNIHFLSAEKFFEHKIWRILMLLTGQIRVDRNVHDKSRVHDIVKRHVDRGNLIGIFPEGTRSPFRNQMLKAFTGVGRYALEHKVPIIPVGIIGTYDIHSKDQKKIKFRKIVEINVGEPLHFHEHHGLHDDKSICTLVTEKAIKKLEKLSFKEYPHYEFKHE